MPRQVDFADDDFRVPSFCYDMFNITCVAVAMKGGRVAVRNSNDNSRTTVEFSPEEWRVFVEAVKAGEFDLEPPL